MRCSYREAFSWSVSVDVGCSGLSKKYVSVIKAVTVSAFSLAPAVRFPAKSYKMSRSNNNKDHKWRCDAHELFSIGEQGR